MVYISEYKPPHELATPHLRLGLRSLDIYKEVVNRKIPTSVDLDARFRYYAERLAASAITQTYHYFFTIQAMSAECERIFSAARLMATPIRASLDAQISGICQVLRSWLRAGIVSNKGAIVGLLGRGNRQRSRSFEVK
ncbi:Uncharacterized protein TPAR_08428 [Tolypocladium paradoxum]|uniref:HAT C-terminal dimerisation domain-containing protein n=1 Tax=Tolypocladium paradoxum TaxID=94208 RepID=A0A2S4KMF0_9HYPO|nr:Uncharacterized protein TPAR_08428 [Tolypocladium paradoxum]